MHGSTSSDSHNKFDSHIKENFAKLTFSPVLLQKKYLHLFLVTVV